MNTSRSMYRHMIGKNDRAGRLLEDWEREQLREIADPFSDYWLRELRNMQARLEVFYPATPENDAKWNAFMGGFKAAHRRDSWRTTYDALKRIVEDLEAGVTHVA